MPLSSICRNCGFPKTPQYYGENYCEACTTAVDAAKAEAVKDGLNPYDAQRRVLAQRAHDLFRNRPDPRDPFTKNDYWQSEHPSNQQPPR